MDDNNRVRTTLSLGSERLMYAHGEPMIELQMDLSTFAACTKEIAALAARVEAFEAPNCNPFPAVLTVYSDGSVRVI